MEQQSISIAKAGIVCSLPARTTIIAAANPQAGHYNKAKTILQNLKLNPALLSRFDLIFILIDKPDEIKDQLLSEHVIHMHNGGRKKTAATTKKEEGTSLCSIEL
jgi:DNA helicase MCM8